MRLWEQARMAHEKDMRERVVRLIEVEPNLSRVACIDSNVVGCVLCSYNGFSAYLFRLVVDERVRNQGVGEALVDACESAARVIHAPKVSLDTSGFVGDWLVRRGFSVTSERYLFKLLT
jgi:N-acetylglutamate synthase-like GNAT family acetyltransferase